MEALIRPDGKRIEAVAFDMDGVVFDTEPIYRAATVEALRSLGYPNGSTLARGMVGRTEGQCAAILRRTFGTAFPIKEFDLQYRSSRDDLLRDGVPVKREVHDTLERLRGRGMPVVLVTNSRRDTAVGRLSKARLLEYFEVVVTSDYVANPKPAADVYLWAAARLSLPPRRGVALEDSPVGVQAAKGAGFYTILVAESTEGAVPDAVAADVAAALRPLGLYVEDRNSDSRADPPHGSRYVSTSRDGAQ